MILSPREATRPKNAAREQSREFAGADDMISIPSREFDYEQRRYAEVLIALCDNDDGDECLRCNFDYHIAAAIIPRAFVGRLIVQGETDKAN